MVPRPSSSASVFAAVSVWPCVGVPLIVTYHPAYLLRTLPDKAKAWQDLLFAVGTMEGLQVKGPAPI